MNENLKDLMNKLSADADLREKIAEQISIEEAYTVATQIIAGFTLEEFTTALEAFCRDAEHKLSDDALADVVGGAMAPRTPPFKGIQPRL